MEVLGGQITRIYAIEDDDQRPLRAAEAKGLLIHVQTKSGQAVLRISLNAARELAGVLERRLQSSGRS